MLRDDQIVDILQLVDFRISKGEIGNFFRNADHPKYVECGDQVLRNFLNGLVIHLRGTKDQPKNPSEAIEANRANAQAIPVAKPKPAKNPAAKKPFKPGAKKQHKTPIVENVKFGNGKKKQIKNQ